MDTKCGAAQAANHYFFGRLGGRFLGSPTRTWTTLSRAGFFLAIPCLFLLPHLGQLLGVQLPGGVTPAFFVAVHQPHG